MFGRKNRRLRALGFQPKPVFTWVNAAKTLFFGGLAILVGSQAAVPIMGFVNKGEGCQVTRVVDGDTVKVLCPGLGRRSGRIVGYDTPELFSPSCPYEQYLATKATAYLSYVLVTGGRIDALPDGTDRYDRLLISLRVSGRSVAERMVGAGLARWYSGGQRGSWCSGGFLGV